MIQRIQSLLLFASCILLVVFLFVPIWKKEEKILKKSFAGINPTKKVVLTAFITMKIAKEIRSLSQSAENLHKIM